MPMRLNPRTGQYEDSAGNEGEAPTYDAADQAGGYATTGAYSPPAQRPTDQGGEKPATQPSVQPTAQKKGWSYQGTGYQKQARPQLGAYGGQTAVAAPPPPPPLPVLGAAPNFAGLANTGAAPDYLGMVGKMPQAQRGQGYKGTQDFNAIAARMGAAQRGPEYETADGAWQGESLSPDLEGFARNWLGNYNPLSTEYGQKARAASDLRLRNVEQEQTKGLEEFMASRGLVGSSVETDGRVAQNEAIRRATADDEADLLRTMADYELAGRGAASGNALNVGNYQRALGADRRDEGRFSWEADRTVGRDFEDDNRFRTSSALNAAGMQEQQDQFEFGTDYDAGRDYLGDLYQRTGMELDAAQMGEAAGMNRANMRLNAAGMEEGANVNRARYGMDAARFGEDAAFRRAGIEEGNVNRGIGLWNQNNDNAKWGAGFDQIEEGNRNTDERSRNAMEQNERQFRDRMEQDDFYNGMDIYKFLYGNA